MCNKLRALFDEVALMRIARVAVLCGLAVAAGSCAREPEAPATPAVLNPEIQGTLNQVMRGILFPNSNIIFDAQDRDPAAEPDPNDPTASVHPFAGTYGGWEAVENAAIALGEAANLIVLPGRTCQNGKPVPLNEETFQKGVAGLRQIAAETLKTAQSKNLDAMLDIADRLTTACATCHDVYRDTVVDGKTIGIEDRCTS
jgi:hypothetical protein